MKRIFKSDKKEEEELSLRYDILDIKDKINECQTSDIGDEYVSLIFKETKKNILYSVVCKDTDKFIIAFNELKRKYRDLNENEYECKCGDKIIYLDKSLIENQLNNSDIINLEKKIYLY